MWPKLHIRLLNQIGVHKQLNAQFCLEFMFRLTIFTCIYFCEQVSKQRWFDWSCSPSHFFFLGFVSSLSRFFLLLCIRSTSNNWNEQIYDVHAAHTDCSRIFRLQNVTSAVLFLSFGGKHSSSCVNECKIERRNEWNLFYFLALVSLIFTKIYVISEYIWLQTCDNLMQIFICGCKK